MKSLYTNRFFFPYNYGIAIVLLSVLYLFTACEKSPSNLDCTNQENCVNGECINDVCVCKNGWYGTNCDSQNPEDSIVITNSCEGIECVNGTCINGVCVCDDGWYGTNCEVLTPVGINLCENVDCNENSNCNTETGACECNDFYYGDSCENKFITFKKTFGGSESELGSSTIVVNDDELMIIGSTASFGVGSEDVYLIKTDGNGNEQWSKTFGGSNSDWGSNLIQTTDGGFIIIGTTESFGAGSDIYLIKTDGNGNELWSKTFGGSDYDYGRDVAQTADGGFIIIGATSSFGAGNKDVYLIKTDGNGNELWSKTFGGSNYDFGQNIIQTVDEGFIISAETQSFSTTDRDAYLIKTDSDGNEQWSKTFGSNESDFVRSIAQTTDGGFIIAGFNRDIYIIKTDSNGNEQWTQTFGGSGSDFGQDIVQTTDGGFIIIGGTSSFTAENYDIYLIKTDAIGNELWTQTFGGSEWEKGHNITQTTDGGFIITGITESFGSGKSDIYLIKTDPKGDVQ